MTHARRADVDFFADISCPWCYVGWEALKRAAAERTNLCVNLNWRTFLLNPDMPAEGYERGAYLAAKFPDRARLEAIHEALAAAARDVGAPLAFDRITRTPSTVNAHRLILWAAGQGRAEAAVDALFAAMFAEGRDIGDAAVLRDIAEAIGLDAGLVGELLASDADRAAIAARHNAATRLGVTGVPVVIINQKAVLMGAETPEAYGGALDQCAAPVA